MLDTSGRPVTIFEERKRLAEEFTRIWTRREGQPDDGDDGDDGDADDADDCDARGKGLLVDHIT